MKKAIFIILVIAVMSPGAPVQAQDTFTVNFSDPSRPGLLKVSLFNGAITVKSHTGRDVIIDAKGGGDRRRRSAPSTTPDGLRRIDSNGNDLSIEEQNNVMTVVARNFSRSGDLEIQVPSRTNLNLTTMNGGDIVVDGVEGEIEVTNTNGGVVLNNVSGAVVAHSMNGRVLATLREALPDKAMSFSSMNGNIDITLPGTTKANLKIRSDNGASYSDFDIQLRPNAAPTVEDGRNRGGRIRIQTDRTITGSINGGGPDIDLRTFNGNIYIRRAK
jgi:hypothetical protein